MAQPIDYTQGFINPTQSIMQTLQMGQALGQIGQMRDQRMMAQQAAQASLAEQAARAQKQKEMEDAFKAAHDNPTYENYRRLADMSPPEQAESFRKSWDRLDKMQQEQALNDSVSIYAGFLSGAPEVSLSMIQDRMNAAKNAGDENSAKRYQTMIDLYNTGPEGVKAVRDMFGMSISGMTGGKDAMEALSKFAEERRNEEAEPTARKKALADLGLTNAQIDETIARTNKLNAEIKKMNDDLAVAKVSGGLDPEKKFNSELSLNKEYTTRTKSYDESLRLNDVIKTSAASGTGAGDLALINTFMKMLDPGSVVRESEFAQAQDTAGLVSKLAASLGRVKNGEVLVPAQRAEFAKLANEYMQAATKNEEKVRDGINFMVKSYGLNPENVFGTMANETTKKPNRDPLPDTIQTSPSATVKQPTIKVDY